MKDLFLSRLLVLIWESLQLPLVELDELRESKCGGLGLWNDFLHRPNAGDVSGIAFHSQGQRGLSLGFAVLAWLPIYGLTFRSCSI